MKIMALCTVDKEKLKKQKNLSAEANHENVIPEEFSQLRRAGLEKIPIRYQYMLPFHMIRVVCTKQFLYL